jgi:hypothetical protein
MKFPTDDAVVVDYDPAKINDFALEVFCDLYCGLEARKEEACRRRGAGTDIPATVLYLPMQRSALYSVAPATVGFDLPMQELLTLVLSFMNTEVGPPRLIGFGADAAMKMYPKEAEAEAFGVQRGSILAGLGRDPQVRETLTAMVVHRLYQSTELRRLNKLMPYHYDGRKLIWDTDDGLESDSLTTEQDVTGGIEAIVATAFATEGN